MTLKSYDEMDASHRLAYKMGREDAIANLPNSLLDGYPDLYEISAKAVSHLEALGIPLRKVPHERIAAQVLKNLDHEAAEAVFEQWMDLDVIHIEYHREATGGGPVEAILAAAQKGQHA